MAHRIVTISASVFLPVAIMFCLLIKNMELIMF